MRVRPRVLWSISWVLPAAPRRGMYVATPLYSRAWICPRNEPRGLMGHDWSTLTRCDQPCGAAGSAGLGCREMLAKGDCGAKLTDGEIGRPGTLDQP